jgi:hypothetical protein
MAILKMYLEMHWRKNTVQNFRYHYKSW